MSRILERWSDIDPILTGALELEPQSRTDYITKECGSDTELRELVEGLIDSVGDADSPVTASGALAGPLWDAMLAEPLAEGVSEEAVAGTEIGPYRIVREVGRGGMAVVYLADRVDGAYEQSVAIKVLNVAFPDPRTRLRFDRERNILARLDHPHIARLLDGGETDGGAPYLVMEYVEGLPIDRYCETNGLDRNARLSLIRDVADAVQHAHQNLVVHRDIKPSNVLVDGSGRVRLLDFGIAGLVSRDSVEDADRSITVGGARPLTPAFASPEQARGDVPTTSSDVYQLGLLLYRLLVGRAPYVLDGANEAEWRRIVCDTDPTPPGLKSDLDAVILTALRKEPAERYRSAEAFADDIRRAQRNQPVAAKPDTPGYRFSRFVRRNRFGVAAGSIITLAILGLTVAVGIQSWRLGIERDRAEEEAETSSAVSDFLVGLFYHASAVRGPTATLSARDLVDRGVEELKTDLTEEPAARGRLLMNIGTIYYQLGEAALADSLLREARTALESAPQSSTDDLANCLSSIAHNMYMTGDQAERIELYERSLALHRRVHGEDTIIGAAIVYKLAEAHLLSGDRATYGRHFETVTTMFGELPCDSTTVWVSLARDIATIYEIQREYDRAAELRARALGVSDARGFDGYSVELSKGIALNHYRRNSDLKAAEPYARRAVELGWEVYGGVVSSAARILALAEFANAHATEAESLATAALAGAPTYEPDTVEICRATLAEILNDVGKPAAALPHAREAEAALAAQFPDGSQIVALAHLQRLRADAGVAADGAALADAEIALAHLIDLAEASKRKPGAWGNSRLLGQVWVALGDVRARQLRWVEAIPAYEAAVEVFGRSIAADHWRVGRASVRLAACHLATGNTERAGEALRVAEPILAARGDGLGEEYREFNRALARALSDR